MKSSSPKDPSFSIFYQIIWTYISFRLPGHPFIQLSLNWRPSLARQVSQSSQTQLDLPWQILEGLAQPASNVLEYSNLSCSIILLNHEGEVKIGECDGMLESERFEAFRSSRARVYITRGCSHIESSSIPPPILLGYEPGRRAFTIKTHQLLPPLRHGCKFFSRLPSFPTPFVSISS